VDIIGKILTPFLILSLTILIVVGTLNAPKELADNGYTFREAFAFGFSKGYLTLDVLAGVIFSGLIISSIVREGYQREADKKQVQEMVRLNLGLKGVPKPDDCADALAAAITHAAMNRV